MTFLAMMIALSLQQVLRSRDAFPGDTLLRDWQHWLRGRVDTPWLLELVALAVPLAVLHWTLGVIAGWLFGLPTLAATAGLLLWSLGREDYHTAMEHYIAADEGAGGTALPGAHNRAAALWVPEPGAGDALQRLAYCGYQRWFAPLLYFLLLGPVAAVAYRMVQLWARREDAESRAGRFADLLGWADWIPARLLALSFAVTGDFVAVVRRTRAEASLPAAELLLDAAAASVPDLDGPGLRDLLYRTAGLWLLVASLLIVVI